jgi:hypothetical protein
MKKTGISGPSGPVIKTPSREGILKAGRFSPALVLALFFCLSPVFGADPQRAPINVNLIIDGSAALSGVKDEITSWVSSRLDAILAEGDSVTVWNAGGQARVVYTGKIGGASDKEAVKQSIRDFSASGSSVDYSGALREAAGKQNTGISYTLLICASPAALSSTLNGPQANLLRFSRVEEFSGWRALVVGLNIDSKVRRAAAAFFGS